MPLEHPQKLRLDPRAHLADLVEKQRALVGGFKLSGLALGGAGEGALFVAEQFALQERLRQGRAVHADEWGRAPAACLVDGPRDEFLAGTALAADQHGGLGGRHPLDLADDGLQPGTGADHPPFLAQSPSELFIFVR